MRTQAVSAVVTAPAQLAPAPTLRALEPACRLAMPRRLAAVIAKVLFAAADPKHWDEFACAVYECDPAVAAEILHPAKTDPPLKPSGLGGWPLA